MCIYKVFVLLLLLISLVNGKIKKNAKLSVFLAMNMSLLRYKREFA